MLLEEGIVGSVVVKVSLRTTLQHHLHRKRISITGLDMMHQRITFGASGHLRSSRFTCRGLVWRSHTLARVYTRVWLCQGSSPLHLSSPD